MGYIEDFKFDEPKLLAFYLGGKTEKSTIEVHDVMFLVAQNLDEAIPKLKDKWYGVPKSLHIDSWLPLENIDGYDVSLVKSTEDLEQKQSLYFVNLGAYRKGEFGELHFMSFVVASSIEEAKLQAKSKVQEKLDLIHTDDLYEVDDCIAIRAIDSYKVSLEKGSKNTQVESTNGWLRLPRQ